MIKINEDFELDNDGNQWILHEWFDGKVWNPGNELVKAGWVSGRQKRKPRHYSELEHACRAIVDRSAGNACSRGENIVDAIHNAVADIRDTIGARGFRNMWE